MAKISDTSAYPSIATLDPADYLIITDAENKLMTKTCTIQQLQAEFGIDTLVAHVEITSTQLQSIGSSPKTIIAAPGTDKVIDLLSISIYGKYGTTTYDFSGDLEFDCNSTVFASLAAVTANSSQDFVQKLIIGGGAGNSLTLSANQDLAFTASGGNPTQGDGTFFVNAYYRILTVGTTF
jgi:hypothetical protein